jgi:hypothetical protein
MKSNVPNSKMNKILNKNQQLEVTKQEKSTKFCKLKKPKDQITKGEIEQLIVCPQFKLHLLHHSNFGSKSSN